MPTLTSYNPVNRTPLGEVVVTEPSQITAKVVHAKQAQKNWAALSIDERKQKVVQAYAHLAEVQDQLTLLISQEMGKDYRRATYEAAVPFRMRRILQGK